MRSSSFDSGASQTTGTGNGWCGWSEGEAGRERIGGIDEVLAKTGHPSAAGDLRNDAESSPDCDFLENCAG